MEAIVTPVHKKGKKEIAGDYRPINLACIAGKTLESIKVEILLFMINNNLLTIFRHSFVSGKSCQSSLSIFKNLTDAIKHSLEKDFVSLDFAKAFDFASYKKLIHKSEKYNSSGKLLFWVKDFLSNRIQQVDVIPHYPIGHTLSAVSPEGMALVPFSLHYL